MLFVDKNSRKVQFSLLIYIVLRLLIKTKDCCPQLNAMTWKLMICRWFGRGKPKIDNQLISQRALFSFLLSFGSCLDNLSSAEELQNTF